MASWVAVAKTEPTKAAEAPMETELKPRVAVLDTNAIINGNGLLNLMRTTDRVITIPEVLREVRDKQSRSTLAALPFKIQTQEPSEDSIKAVIKFARATGDLHALSVVDTRLLALARTIEVSYYGASHLRDLPAPPKVEKKRAVDTRTLPGWGAEGGDWKELDRLNEEEEVAAAAALQHNTSSADWVKDTGTTTVGGNSNSSVATTSHIAAGIQQLHLDSSESDNAIDNEHQGGGGGGGGGVEDGWEVAAKTRNKQRRARRRNLRHAAYDEEEERPGQNLDLEEDSEADMSIVHSRESGSEESGESGESEESEGEGPPSLSLSGFESAVCSLTADFAMQNVLLQMGLRLVAPDGRRVSTLSLGVLRCTACMQVTKEVGRLFCPRCGNATLDRVRVVVGADGAAQYGVRKKHVLRGTKFSLPKPKGGRAGRAAEPILREDQLLTKKHLLRAKKAAAAKNELDPFAPEYSEDTWHQVGAVLAGSKSAAALLGGWKTNPNERKHIATNRRRK